MKMKNIFQCLLLCLFAIFPNFASANDAVLRVRVLSKYDFSSVEIHGSKLRIRLVMDSGGVKETWREGEILKLRASGDKVDLPGTGSFSRLEIRPLEGSMALSSGKVLFRRFEGELRVDAYGGVLRFIENLPLESYVRGVLASEMEEVFPIEAQKAQAVLIRSYALSHRGRHADEGYDFCDLTHCQAYGGLDRKSGIRDEATQSTRSLILTFDGRPVEALFHSTCGGHTSPNQRVFGGRPLSYLQGVDDGEYCAASPHSLWNAQVPLEKISAILAGDSALVANIPLRGLAVGESESQGRVFDLRLIGPQIGKISTMDFLSRLGQALGWNQLKSNWFEMSLQDGVVSFSGHGLGHGVGMCQWGARGMALAGFRFDQILRHYFPGARLQHGF